MKVPGEMKKTKLLIANFIENSLIGELLRRDYEIATVNTRISGRLPSRLAIEKFDLVYFAKFHPPIWDDIDVLLHKTKTPVIYAYHAPSSRIFNPYRARSYVRTIISSIKLVYIKIAKPVVALHALSTSEYNKLKSFGLRCYYIPLGVNTKLFNQGLKSNRFTVLFDGPQYAKGADMLIKIVPKILKKAPDLKFRLTGRGVQSQYFASLKSSFANNIEVYTWLPRDEFAKLLSTSHVLLFPSRHETFGLVVLEALSSGMPVVCYDIPGAPKDIVKKRGIGVTANSFNIDKIVNGILGYYEMWKNEPEGFKRLSIECRNVALKYDWSIIAGLFDNMFREVLRQEGLS